MKAKFKEGDKVLVSDSGIKPLFGRIEYVREIEGIYLYYVNIHEYFGTSKMVNEFDLTLATEYGWESD